MKKIIHIDMDAFYASVEQRDFPEMRGKPVVVGGSPHSRGVVCAASYEARKFGVRSAIPCFQAYKLCPDAIFTPPRFEVYKAVSKEIRSIFLEYTDLVEPLSLDEAYLDVTINKLEIPLASTIAREIRKKIFERTGLTCSAGVAQNKFLAKMASEKNKPNGLYVVLPGEEERFLDDLPLYSFHGIGKKTYERLSLLGFTKGSELRKAEETFLIQEFGKMGAVFYRMARGVDDRDVIPFRDPKSIGVETTFTHDSEDFSYLILTLETLSNELELRMSRKNKQGKTLTLKTKFEDFTVKQKSISSESVFYLADNLFQQSSNLLATVWKENTDPVKKIRLLGISVTNFISDAINQDQPSLFG
ncbi:DNA polymerase IV [Leptospira vanthielii]|uniref:DNA polymerase IV n=1 Tax=Leptospira vanthielii TaxID=293085 RepID=A0ABY2NIR9_9LEPT|nr:DNA polymerase IV [Leptospira vanthielii]TGM45458.1 DNA polymerase IV [Leptospira vanthielii]